MLQIIPTVLEKNFDLVEERLEKIGGLSRWIQIDVIDGKFSYGKSFELELLNRLEKDLKRELLLDIHLMVKEPIKWIGKCNFVDANRLIGQVEMMGDRNDFVNMVKDNNMEVGLAFDIETKIEGVLPKDLDVVLLLARKSGFENFNFDEKIWEKLKKLKELRQTKSLKFKIGIDGGVGLEKVEKLEKMGVDIIYSGRNYIKIINDQNN
ncbi:hypothetical protein DRH14_00330 [Candidatus Shapirobacteria bacterium]|nr:MAG: hypothetical protein DRH14_00330 [Candidatus Shapirobacteria bacterium]